MSAKISKKQGKQLSDKYVQIRKRKKMVTAETKKVVGGSYSPKERKQGPYVNHNEILLSI